jgi:hypothetical protein
MRKSLLSLVLALVAGSGWLALPTADAAQPLHPRAVCGTPARGTAACHAKVMVNGSGVVPASTTPAASALTPAQLQDAYKLTGLASGGRTVAIVDAYGYPNLERDLATYRSYWGLPACTSASGCLKVVDQNGGTSYPRMDVGWAGEQALDVDAVSAICPDCRIVVVQAKTPSFGNLGAAVNTAAAPWPAWWRSRTATAAPATRPTRRTGASYNHPASPSRRRRVTAATRAAPTRRPRRTPRPSAAPRSRQGRQRRAAGRESVWSGAGSGCSTYNVQRSSAVDVRSPAARSGRWPTSRRRPTPAAVVMAVYYPTSKTTSTWGAGRGHERVGADHRGRLRAVGQLRRLPERGAVRPRGSLFDVTSGSNGSLPDHAVVHRSHGLGRPDRARHAERHRRLLTTGHSGRAGRSRVVRRKGTPGAPRGRVWCAERALRARRAGACGAPRGR